MDAANIDLKSFSDTFYQNICQGRLAPVLQTIEYLHNHRVWIEITTLLIPGLNDSPEELKRLTNWLVNLSPTIPWHVSAFYPAYKMSTLPPTPAEKVYQALEIGQAAGLKYVYAGNLDDKEFSDTLCPKCQKPVIKRHHYQTKNQLLAGGKCPDCQTKIAGRF